MNHGTNESFGPMALLGVIVFSAMVFLLGLWIGNSNAPTAVVTNTSLVGNKEIKECTDNGGDFFATKSNFDTELKAQCILPSKVIKYDK